jgi:hypothetical protein
LLLVFPSFGLYDFYDQSINLQPNRPWAWSLSEWFWQPTDLLG